ncbi:MAG: hypothetical protein HN995_14675 [Candidatus Marinimicrobia bacterium]|jgi:hypothetical protein|nr:hypothetical protein [Candidatus Neomarinimicrobiota bacterium]MBT3576939.1 hypothetical protein [Candidatus Neomarinimicrobiota bacterium]MBT3681392.1 hypothetical protein [Candidatus Neomarinimicrobiota bacterium]MBT3951262.1 hypothetical protein [Candidatus Neomarinimicrobiota bacterium]MBT4254406.1 hypothetical protein [Candidatus Neomarinimicrobiota bacterium]
MNEANWKLLIPLADKRLLQARGQLHQAVQLLTAAGISFVEHRPDDSHTSLLWDSQSNMFLSQTFGPDHNFQIGLSPQNLSCHVLHSHETLLELKLNGTTLKQVASDLQFFLEDHGLPKSVFTMERHFDLPNYPDNWSSPFDTSDQEAFDQLSSAYSNAYPLIKPIAHRDERAGSLLTWPHHFDMAILLSLGGEKSIGIGMSPGDTNYASPYYYVNVWPYPSEDQIIDLPLTFGKWHTEGWIGMVLPMNQIVKEDALAVQKSMVITFLEQAIQHAESISGENR